MEIKFKFKVALYNFHGEFCSRKFTPWDSIYDLRISIPLKKKKERKNE